MLRIPIEIHPFGDSVNKRELGCIIIYNDGTHANRPKYGNYHIRVSICSEGKVYEANIKNHKRDDGWLSLLHKATGELLKIVKKSKDKKLQDS